MLNKRFRQFLILSFACATIAGVSFVAEEAKSSQEDGKVPAVIKVSEKNEPMKTGKFAPIWDSLKQYETPEWFRDAKFGIWAHWGPQCQPERGDWYARSMYIEGEWQYKSHLETYGPASKNGFKELIRDWKAENWDPSKIVAAYKNAGAKYFVALANHHDNFDNYDSTYQPWNSVKLGPKKDLIGGWEKAARENGLRFGVSVHAAHAWTWYEPAQGADKNGPNKGVPYDGNLTKEEGKGQWWEGLDPQDLYAQRHPLSKGNVHNMWHWTPGSGFCPPSQEYCDKFYDRTIELINKYHPDLIYFDDTILPLYPVSDAGMKIAAHFYNSSMAWNGGKLEAVLNGKILSPDQRKCMVWDIERGASPTIEPLPWQTCTCIGSWHYDKGIYERHHYKSAKTVIHTLVDVVSKNGNLLLSVPLKADGTYDSDEAKVVEEIGRWMRTNGESVYGTRPWKVCGEGPAMASAAPLSGQGFNEGKAKFGPEDVRYVTKEDVIYVTILAPTTKTIQLKSLGKGSGLFTGTITNVEMLGSSEKLQWEQGESELTVSPPKTAPNDIAVVLKITTTK